MAIEKRTASKVKLAEGTGPQPCPIGQKYPTLISFIADNAYADGEARIPGSITIFRAAEGGLRMCLNDKAVEESAFVAGNSLTELLEEAEAGLMFQALDWRTQKKWKGKK